MAYHHNPRVVTNGLVLYMDAGNRKSYSGSGTVWNDLSGNVYSGSLVNGPTFNSSNFGSIVFDGSNDYVFRNSNINTGNNFSVFSWINPGSINIRDGIVGNSYSYSTRRGFYLATANNYSGFSNTFFLSIGVDIAYAIAPNNSLILNKWNYVGATVINGGQEIKLYINGIEPISYTTVLSSGNIVYDINEFYIGARYSGTLEPFIGNISNVKIYNRALSSTEILQNYNATKSRFGL
jgi:hypothetical protein